CRRSGATRSGRAVCRRRAPRYCRDAHRLLRGHGERAMILKGSQRTGGRDLATHLSNEYDNERIELASVRGTVADDLHGALAEYEAVAAGTRCVKPLYSLSINP